MAQDHMRDFEKARDQLLAQRRSLAQALADGYKKGQTENHIDRLVNAYQEKKYQIVEGPVQILHQQPKTGHSKGDIISVNGTQFEVNYFLATPAYCKTLAHGGVLSAGTDARIYYYNGEIIRIDIRKL